MDATELSLVAGGIECSSMLRSSEEESIPFINQLSEEILACILSKVETGRQNKILHYMEVSRAWHAAVRVSVHTLSLRSNHFILLEAAKRLPAFENLRNLRVGHFGGWLHLPPTKKPGAWVPLLQSLGMCVHLTTVDFDFYSVKPAFTSADLELLFKGCTNLKSVKLRNAYKPARNDVMPLGHANTVLEVLEIKGAYERFTLPSLHHLVALKVLSIPDGLANFPSFPTTLTNLQSITISQIYAVSVIPPLVDLPLLQTLNFSSWRELRQISALKNLPRLHSLLLSDCSGLQSIGGLGEMTQLEHLHLGGCTHLHPYPLFARMCNIRSLQIYLEDNVDRSFLGRLTSLTSLHIKARGDMSTVSLPEGLEELTCQGRGYFSMPDVGNLARLKRLEVHHCFDESIRGLGELTALRKLVLSDFDLVDLPSLRAFTNLELLDLTFCNSLEELPALPLDGGKLKCVSIEKCELLFRLDNIFTLRGDVKKLEELRLSGLRRVVLLPYLGSFHGLKDLYLHKLDLVVIPPLSPLSALSFLHFERLQHIRSIPPLCNLTSLSFLFFEACNGLLELPALYLLPSLHTVHIMECNNLTSLPNMSGLTSLRDLVVYDCESLADVHNIRDASFLRALRLERLPLVRELPPLEHFKSLESLNLRECDWLRSLPNLENLRRLQTLILEGCSGLKSVPSVVGLRQLCFVDLRRCSSKIVHPTLGMNNEDLEIKGPEDRT